MKIIKNNSEKKPTEKIEVKKPIPSIVKNEIKPIKVERTVAKPIVIAKPKSNSIIIIKPKEMQTVNNSETNNDPITFNKETNTSKETKIQQIDISIEKPIETQYTNIVQQAGETEITYFKVFQEKAIQQEQFTKETTFADNYAPNPDNPKQFKRWQTIQLRKESHEGYEEIEAKEINERREISEETLKAIEENEIEEITGQDYDIEWEYEIMKPSSGEEIKNRPIEYTYGTKEQTFLRAYETIFNWLGINFDGNHKEQFWKAIIYNVSNNQEQLYEIRLSK
jgi:hypothetical protein